MAVKVADKPGDLNFADRLEDCWLKLKEFQTTYEVDIN